MDVRVFLQGEEIPKEYVTAVTVVNATNTLNRASVTLNLPPSQPPYEIRRDGPVRLQVLVDGKLLFDGVVLAQSQTKTPQGGQLMLTAISVLSLLQTLRIGLLSPTLSPANIPSIWLAQMGGTVFLPGYLSDTEKGGGAYDVLSLIFRLVKEIKSQIDDQKLPLFAQKPITHFLQGLLDVNDGAWEVLGIDYGQICKNKNTTTPTTVNFTLEGKEWWRKVKDTYRLSERIAEYPPFTVAAIRFFFPPGNLAELVHAIFQGAMFSGQSVVASLQDILFALLSYMLLNYIEVPTERGMSLVPKPRLLSALPPRSNVLPAYTVQGISLSIADTQVPTRTVVVPTLLAIPGADPTVLRIISSSYMVAYPEEIEKKALLLGLRIMERAGLIKKADPRKPITDLAREYYSAKCSMPKPLMAVISDEERKRGVIPNTVEVPTQLQALVDQFLGKTDTFRAWLTLYGWAAYNHLTLEGQARRAQVQSIFNPYALVDHTVVFSDGNQIYMGHAEEIVHTITPSGAYTTYNLSHVRVITDALLEEEIPDKERPQKGETAVFDRDENEFFGEDFTLFDLVVSGTTLQTPDYVTLKDYHGQIYGIDYLGEYNDRVIANYLLDTTKGIDFALNYLWPRRIATTIDS